MIPGNIRAYLIIKVKARGADVMQIYDLSEEITDYVLDKGTAHCGKFAFGFKPFLFCH